MLPEWIQVGLALSGVIFIAGGAYRQLRQISWMRRDINGIGARLRDERAARIRCHYAILLLTPREDQQRMAEFLNDGDES